MIALFLALFIAPQDHSSEWRQWRGANRDGATSLAAPDPLPEKLTRAWRTEVGLGYGSPVAMEGRVFLLTGDGAKERVLALDPENGQILWRHEYSVAFKENSYAVKFGKGPFATPLAAGGKVYTVGVAGAVHCLDAQSGALVWRADFDGELTDDRLLFCGNTASPLAYGDTVIVHVGDETHGRMVAYDKDSGREHWAWEGDIAGYASPVLAELDGKTQIVTLTQNWIAGIDPETGALLWRRPYKVEWRENIVTPLIHGDGVIVSGREQNAVMKLAVLREEGAWRSQPLWRNEATPMYMSSPVLENGRLFGFSHKKQGHLFCLDPASGEAIWQGPGRLGESAALVAFEGLLMALTTDGSLLALDPKRDEYAPLRRYEVADSAAWAHPLPTSKGLLIKDKAHLTAWRF